MLLAGFTGQNRALACAGLFLAQPNPSVPFLVIFLLPFLNVANANPLPPAATGQAQDADPALAAEASAETALLPLAQQEEDEEPPPLRAPIARMPVELDVTVAVREFRVRNLLALEPGQVIETQWGHGDDVPLSAGDVQLAWSEFEVVDSQLAVRITRLV
jgi:flagellar motor switch/type III secretory pathway protein FliN